MSYREIEKFLKTLVGGKDVEKALQRLGRLTQEETQLVTAKNLELAQIVKEGTHTPFCCP